MKSDINSSSENESLINVAIKKEEKKNVAIRWRLNQQSNPSFICLFFFYFKKLDLVRT